MDERFLELCDNCGCGEEPEEEEPGEEPKEEPKEDLEQEEEYW